MRKILAVLIVLALGVLVNAQKPDYEIFNKGYIEVVGFSASGQERYSAIRAATVVAQRNLLEVTQGVWIHGETTVGKAMLESEIITTKVEGTLKGAIRTKCEYFPDGHAEVRLRLYLTGRGGLYETLFPLLKKEKMLPKGTPYQPKEIRLSEIVNPYDGLIVDVRNVLGFKPAIINRIITKNNEVIYDPLKVLGAIILKRGCAGYAPDIDKAKALLETWGSKNPLIVKAKDVVDFTDVQVSDDDAVKIYVHNKKTNFLTEGRVVFVL